MANTTSNSSLRQQLWDKELFADAMDKLFFMSRSMIGEGENFVVQTKSDLKKQKGDRINFGMGQKLSGDGVTGDSELEGNEEAITYYNDTVLIDQIRNAVRLTGRLDEQKAANNLRMDAKEKGSIWIAEFLENQIFMKLGGVSSTDLTRVDDSTVYSGRATWSNTGNAVPTADEAAGTGNRYLCTDASGLDSLAATDVLTTSFITRARVKAELASPRIRPIRVDGQNFFVMFIHPWQAADLKTNSSDVWAQAQREAQERGRNNPIFTGALGVWDGVILHSHEYVPTCQASSDFVSGATSAGARAFRAILCGQQAACMAHASDLGQGAASTFMREKTFDYENKAGFAVGYIGGIQKPTFNSLDYAAIQVDSGATDIG